MKTTYCLYENNFDFILSCVIEITYSIKAYMISTYAIACILSCLSNQSQVLLKLFRRGYGINL